MKSETIGLLDDDSGILRSLDRLLRGRGYQVRQFSSPQEFLGSHGEADLDCLILDLAMPGVDGLELQARLKQSGSSLPIIFLTGEGDIPSTVKAMKAGAVNFLTKPADIKELMNALRLALMENARHRADEEEIADLRGRFERLSPREGEILRHVIAGKLNKQIAADLGISEQTVKIHRMKITEKMGLPSVAELVRAAHQLHLEPVA